MLAANSIEGLKTKQDPRMILDKPATVSAEWANEIVTLEVSGDIQYDTYGGRDHYRDRPAVDVKFSGNLWKIAGQEQREPSR